MRVKLIEWIAAFVPSTSNTAKPVTDDIQDSQPKSIVQTYYAD